MAETSGSIQTQEISPTSPQLQESICLQRIASRGLEILTVESESCTLEMLSLIGSCLMMMLLVLFNHSPYRNLKWKKFKNRDNEKTKKKICALFTIKINRKNKTKNGKISF